MPSNQFKKNISSVMPVLFVNIGWATQYDGTETIIGNHKYIRENPGAKIGESRAFTPFRGMFECGIGYGRVPSNLHIVFVARDRRDNKLKAVGIYSNAVGAENIDTGWVVAKSRLAERIPVEKRPQINGWVSGQGMRRWALRNGKIEHKKLLESFKWLTKNLISAVGLPEISIAQAEEEEGYEGEVKKLFVRHRRRERKKRRQKIADALNKNDGRLICEVPNCGFDFHEKYGELGDGFAEVHHKKPLSRAPSTGRKVKLADLAIVCANCHRMIHINRQCRPLAGLIPSKKR
jgi:hypothetical protein